MIFAGADRVKKLEARIKSLEKFVSDQGLRIAVVERASIERLGSNGYWRSPEYDTRPTFTAMQGVKELMRRAGISVIREEAIPACTAFKDNDAS